MQNSGVKKDSALKQQCQSNKIQRGSSHLGRRHGQVDFMSSETSWRGGARKTHKDTDNFLSRYGPVKHLN
jgi:hypothetical protein